MDEINPHDSPIDCHDLNAVNDFFSNLGPFTAKDLPSIRKKLTNFFNPIMNTFVLSSITRNKLINIINYLPNKHSCGYDKLNAIHIKAVALHIAPPLLKIINKSFDNGVFPNILKITRVIPIFKSSGIRQSINHRPISVLPTLSKNI